MTKLILASASPRRKELLKVAGVKFTIQVPDVDESPKKGESPQKMVARLSHKKAQAVADILMGNADWIILAADTTVVSAGGKNLGKPRSIAEAKKMLAALQGRGHHVYTAYTLLHLKAGKIVKRISRTIKTTVTFKKLSASEIHYYISQGESMDKAGAYAAQGVGMMLVSKMSGSYTNVVGLPLSHVLDDLKKLGFGRE